MTTPASPRYAFHVTLHARPPQLEPGPTVTLEGEPFATLALAQEALQQTFAVTFEQAAEALAALRRSFVEPDGSFVWVSPSEDAPWQVDGNLYDRGGRLLFVDLKGTCPASEFDRLLAAMGWPETAVLFQVVRAAVFLDEATFRRWATRSAATG